MTDLLQIARDLARFRNLTQTDKAEKDVRSCYADALVMNHFGLVPGSEDMQKSRNGYELLPHDLDGRSLKVCFREMLPFRIYKRLSDFDVYVFVKGMRNFEEFKIHGWLTGAEARQATTHTFENGDFCYEINTENLIKMPEVFNFNEVCDTGAAIWDDTVEAWDCFKCGRMVLDGKTRDAVRRELATRGDPLETQATQNLGTST